MALASQNHQDFNSQQYSSKLLNERRTEFWRSIVNFGTAWHYIVCILNETHFISMNCQPCTININVMTQKINISNLCLLLTWNTNRYPDIFHQLLSPFMLPPGLSSKEILRLSGRPSPPELTWILQSLLPSLSEPRQCPTATFCPSCLCCWNFGSCSLLFCKEI